MKIITKTYLYYLSMLSMTGVMYPATTTAALHPAVKKYITVCSGAVSWINSLTVPVENTFLAVFEIRQTCLLFGDDVTTNKVYAQAYTPMLQLYDALRKKGVTCIFLTGDPCKEQEEIRYFMEQAGFLKNNETIISMLPDEYSARITEIGAWKNKKRQALLKKGWRIICTIGNDEWIDFIGEEHTIGRKILVPQIFFSPTAQPIVADKIFLPPLAEDGKVALAYVPPAALAPSTALVEQPLSGSATLQPETSTVITVVKPPVTSNKVDVQPAEIEAWSCSKSLRAFFASCCSIKVKDNSSIR